MKAAVLLYILFVLHRGSASLYNKLRYFETLATADIVSRSKRSADGGQVRREVSFRAFSRQFRLVLFPGSSVLAPDVRASTVDGKGRHKDFTVRYDHFFKGHLAGNIDIRVQAHFEDGLLCASIHFPHDTVTVEPSWRHLSGGPNDSVIIYRASDVLWNKRVGGKMFMDQVSLRGVDPGVSITPGITPPNETDNIPPASHGANSEKATTWSRENTRKARSRGRRSPSEKKICPMLIVADYSFYRDVGQSDEQYTMMYITWMIDNINRVFMATNWDNQDMTGYGIQIKEFKVHTEYTDVDGHYNQKLNDSDRTHPALLTTAFILNAPVPLENFCLSHLYTNANIGDFKYGFGNIARADPTEPGGICSPASNSPLPGRQGSTGVWHYPNSGCTTARHNPQGGIMLREMIEKTTSHELGHNWGAKHDDDQNDTECMPPVDNSYIMVKASNPLPLYPNNRKFSPCSKRDIAAVLRARSDKCFIPPNTVPDPWMARRQACLKTVREKLSPLISSTILK